MTRLYIPFDQTPNYQYSFPLRVGGLKQKWKEKTINKFDYCRFLFLLVNFNLR